MASNTSTARESARNQESAPQISAEMPSLRELAVAAFEAHNGAVEAALKDLHRKVMGDQALFQSFADPLIKSALRQQVATVMHEDRRRVWNADPVRQVEIQRTGHRIVTMAQAQGLLMFRIPGGKPLGDATRAEVLAAADIYLRQSNEMNRRGRWLLKIGTDMPDGATVREVKDDAALQKMKDAVDRGE